MWYVEKYRPDAKQPYLRAHLQDFAALSRMLTNRDCDRVEIFAPMDARAAHVRKPSARPSVTPSVHGRSI
jgi:hypothetical protein